MTLWFYNILSKTNSPSTLTRSGRISKPELYHTPQQLSQYDCPINIFSTRTKYMQGINIMHANLKNYIHIHFQNFNFKCET